MVRLAKIGVLLINLGTPDSPSVPDVRKYLREFLMDPRVMDIPVWKRWPLINLVIAPTRAPQSASAYRQLWTTEGSPLKFHTRQLSGQLQEAAGEEYMVSWCMR